MFHKCKTLMPRSQIGIPMEPELKEYVKRASIIDAKRKQGPFINPDKVMAGFCRQHILNAAKQVLEEEEENSVLQDTAN